MKITRLWLTEWPSEIGLSIRGDAMISGYEDQQVNKVWEDKDVFKKHLQRQMLFLYPKFELNEVLA
jgi:hypothetical protein